MFARPAIDHSNSRLQISTDGASVCMYACVHLYTSYLCARSKTVRRKMLTYKNKYTIQYNGLLARSRVGMVSGYLLYSLTWQCGRSIGWVGGRVGLIAMLYLLHVSQYRVRPTYIFESLLFPCISCYVIFPHRFRILTRETERDRERIGK